MAMNEDGWPCIFPFATSGETLSAEGYSQSDPVGTFYILDHGLSVDAKVNKPVKCSFKNGKITGDLKGEYTVKDGSNYVTITIDGIEYKGVMINMTDEAGNNTFCISAVGNNNHSIWCVHYME
jgi:arabinan endo-1,5-alpha-L-arabinosidase